MSSEPSNDGYTTADTDHPHTVRDPGCAIPDTEPERPPKMSRASVRTIFIVSLPDSSHPRPAGRARTTDTRQVTELDPVGSQLVAESRHETSHLLRTAEEAIQVQPKSGVIARFQHEVSQASVYQPQKSVQSLLRFARLPPHLAHLGFGLFQPAGIRSSAVSGTRAPRYRRYRTRCLRRRQKSDRGLSKGRSSRALANGGFDQSDRPWVGIIEALNRYLDVEAVSPK